MDREGAAGIRACRDGQIPTGIKRDHVVRVRRAEFGIVDATRRNSALVRSSLEDAIGPPEPEW